MKKSRFSDSQIISILKQAEAGVTVNELCRKHGGMDVPDARRLIGDTQCWAKKIAEVAEQLRS